MFLPLVLNNQLVSLWLLYLHFKVSLVLAFAKDISLAQELFLAIVLNSKYNLFLAFAYQCLE
jgi:hypothetical protein